MAGVAGNGQTELAEVITGLRSFEHGMFQVLGEVIRATKSKDKLPDFTMSIPALLNIIFTLMRIFFQKLTRSLLDLLKFLFSPESPIVRRITELGVAHIPADRTGVGSSPNLSLMDNLTLKFYRQPPLGKGWRVDLFLARQQAKQLVKQFDVKTPGVDTPARSLSGGNLQKLILAREISRQPKVIIAVYPTRGLDVGAIESIHQMLIDERDRGAGILLISEELDELLSLSDRINVIYEGQIMGEVPPDDERVDDIGLMMAGSKVEAAHAN
jgi:ABC-type uncharacterized transport system ATPase subunit